MAKTNTQYKTRIGKYPLKLIHCGLHRAGTTSLAKALDILGMGPIWHPALNKLEDNNKYLKWWDQNKIMQRLEKNEFIDFDIFLNMIKCSTIMDAPASLYWPLFMDYYPNSKIILTIRDFKGWYQSNKFIYKILKSTVIKLIYHYGNAPFLNWLVTKYLVGLEKVWPILNVDENISRQKYLEYIQFVKEGCKDSNRLLIFNCKDGWKPLCEFLNVEIPQNVPFPFKNSEDSVRRKVMTGFIESVLFNKLRLIFIFVIIVLLTLDFRFN